MTQLFEVENIKCGGCTNSIRKGLQAMDGVQEVEADNQNGTVHVAYDETSVSTENIVKKLAEMGYPLIGHNTFGQKAKSYVSCAIGRLG